MFQIQPNGRLVGVVSILVMMSYLKMRMQYHAPWERLYLPWACSWNMMIISWKLLYWIGNQCWYLGRMLSNTGIAFSTTGLLWISEQPMRYGLHLLQVSPIPSCETSSQKMIRYFTRACETFMIGIISLTFLGMLAAKVMLEWGMTLILVMIVLLPRLPYLPILICQNSFEGGFEAGQFARKLIPLLMWSFLNVIIKGGNGASRFGRTSWSLGKVLFYLILWVPCGGAVYMGKWIFVGSAAYWAYSPTGEPSEETDVTSVALQEMSRALVVVPWRGRPYSWNHELLMVLLIYCVGVLSGLGLARAWYVPIEIREEGARLVNFGRKHARRRFDFVFEKDFVYCSSILQQQTRDQGMQRFQRYVLKRAGYEELPWLQRIWAVFHDLYAFSAMVGCWSFWSSDRGSSG